MNKKELEDAILYILDGAYHEGDTVEVTEEMLRIKNEIKKARN